MPPAHQPLKKETLLGEGLMELMQQSGQVCLTILCPLHPSNPDRYTDRLSLKHLAQQAGVQIQKHWEPAVAERLLHQLEIILDQIDLVHPPQGLGIYLNERFQRVESYPFAVPPEVYVDKRFPIRECLWYLQLSRPVYLLSLSEHQLRLEEIRNGNWTEIKDHFFPNKIHDEYEYSKPARSSSYAGHSHVKIFERDKLEMQHTRLRSAFRDSNTPLRPYLMNDEPLILAGPERDISLFRQVSDHGSRVIAQLSGNYQVGHQELFRDKVSHAIREHRQIQMQQWVSTFFEKWGSGLARCGLNDCWQAVEAGQGLMLLVERGYREPMYQSIASGQFSKESTAAGSRYTPDAIDELMEKTIEKGGTVMLVDNYLLFTAQRVALILRYSTQA